MKLNIGGQQRGEFLDGWTCVDILPGADVICNIQKEHLPFDDNSANAIYCSHVLEHLWVWNHPFVMKEFLRVLKPDCKLRVVVPDMDIGIKKYLESDKKGQALAIYMRWWFDPAENKAGGAHHFNHVGGFNEQLLYALFSKTGWRNILKKSTTSFSKVFTDCDSPAHFETSLYMEATK